MDELTDPILVSEQAGGRVQLPEQDKEHKVKSCRARCGHQGLPINRVIELLKVPKDLHGWELPPAGRVEQGLAQGRSTSR